MPHLIPEIPNGALPPFHTLEIPGHQAWLHIWPRDVWPHIGAALGPVAACYVLLEARGDDRKIRVGETQDVVQRIERHQYDQALDWSDTSITIAGPGIDKSKAGELQYALETYVRDHAEATLMAFAPAFTPRISAEEWRQINRLVVEIRAGLPRLGVILNPEQSWDPAEGARPVERIIDIDDVDEVYSFATRGFEASAVRIGRGI